MYVMIGSNDSGSLRMISTVFIMHSGIILTVLMYACSVQFVIMYTCSVQGVVDNRSVNK